MLAETINRLRATAIKLVANTDRKHLEISLLMRVSLLVPLLYIWTQLGLKVELLLGGCAADASGTNVTVRVLVSNDALDWKGSVCYVL